jgi:hypothetical protein
LDCKWSTARVRYHRNVDGSRSIYGHVSPIDAPALLQTSPIKVSAFNSTSFEEAAYSQPPARVADLFPDYANSFNFDLCFEKSDKDLDGLPADRAPPEGSLMLARIAGWPAGCVALRRSQPGICEMERL